MAQRSRQLREEGDGRGSPPLDDVHRAAKGEPGESRTGTKHHSIPASQAPESRRPIEPMGRRVARIFFCRSLRAEGTLSRNCALSARPVQAAPALRRQPRGAQAEGARPIDPEVARRRRKSSVIVSCPDRGDRRWLQRGGGRAFRRTRNTSLAARAAVSRRSTPAALP
jgi:hypothetical protein